MVTGIKPVFSGRLDLACVAQVSGNETAEFRGEVDRDSGVDGALLVEESL